MRLKFYLMGLGIGVIVAAVIMGIAMRGRTREMTDEEIMARARQLGMVEAGTLAEMTAGETNQNADQNGQTITQTQQRETPAAQTAASAADSRETAGNENTAGESGTIGTENEEGADAADGTDRTDPDQSLVVEGEPVAAEEAADEAGTEARNTNTAGSGNTATRAQNRAGAAVTTAPDQTSNSDASAARTETATADSAQATGSIVVTIPDGLYSEDIAALLETAGVVDNATAFNDYLVTSGKDRYITVGARLIPRGSSYEDVANIITGR